MERRASPPADGRGHPSLHRTGLRIPYFLQTLFLTSGQNSANAFPDIRPTTPSKHRNAALPAPFSLWTLHVFDRKLFPTFPIYRAYAGCSVPSRRGATNVALITYFTRVPNPRR